MSNSQVPLHIRSRGWWSRKVRLSHLIAATTLFTGLTALGLGILGFMTTGSHPVGLGAAIYRSMQLFVGTFPGDVKAVGLFDWLGLARLLAIGSTLAVTITTVTSLLKFPIDVRRAVKARGHVVLVGDRPELDELATRITLPHLDTKGSLRKDRGAAVLRDWPCHRGAPVVRIKDISPNATVAPSIRSVDRARTESVRGALIGAARVVIACQEPGDTIRTVRDVMESDVGAGATVHVLASHELRGPLEAAKEKRSTPVTLDAFSIEGRAVSLLFSKLQITPEWSVLVVTPANHVGSAYASSVTARCLGQLEADTFRHLAVDRAGHLGEAFQLTAAELVGDAARRAAPLVVIVAGYPDSEVLEIESVCKRVLDDLSCVGMPTPASFAWVVALITEDRLGSVSDKSSISTNAIVSDPLDLAETTLTRVADRVAPEAEDREMVTRRLAQAIRDLEGWYIERIPFDDPELTDEPAVKSGGEHLETRRTVPLGQSKAGYDGPAVTAALDARANDEIRALAADLQRLGADTASTAAPSFAWFRNLLAVCGEPYRKRAVDRTTFEARLTELAHNGWAQVDYTALGVPASTKPERQHSDHVPMSSGLRTELVNKYVSKVAELLGSPGAALPSEGSITPEGLATPITLGRGSPRWWRPPMLGTIADLLVADDPRMNDCNSAEAFETYYAALVVLECVPMALKGFGLALTDKKSTFSEARVWVGAQQVHGEYERRFGSKRDPAAFTTKNWDQSRHSYRTDNFRGALRALGYVAFLQTFSKDSDSTLWEKQDRITNGDAGQDELKALLGNLPDPVIFVTAAEHERWSIGKMHDRWCYAATRNDHLHLHPDLLPWAMLSEGERIKDVNVVLTADRVRAAMSGGETI